MKTEVACDVCGERMPSEIARFDVGTERDLCEEHYFIAKIEDAKQEKETLVRWLESTHLKRLRELDQKIVLLEAEHQSSRTARQLGSQ